MGGFAFEPRLFGKSFLPGNLTRLTLTGKAVEILTINEPDLISKISAEDIKDKSKANALGKTLVCLQASWFCLQCVTRVRQGLAITLLELNTFAHALCTLLIFLLWWNKPLDIEQPTIIRGEHADIICAMMVMLDYINQGPQSIYKTRFRSTDSASLEYVPSEVAALSKPPLELDEEGWLAYFIRNLPSAPTKGDESGPAKGQITVPIEVEEVIRMEDLAGYSMVSLPLELWASSPTHFQPIFLRVCKAYMAKHTGASTSRLLISETNTTSATARTNQSCTAAQRLTPSLSFSVPTKYHIEHILGS